MKIIVKKLTKEERDIVEVNHNLIYSFLHNRGLSEDEYYGLVAESLCKSVQLWDKEKGSLATLFYSVADRHLSNYWRRELAEKRQGDIIDIDICDIEIQENKSFEDKVINGIMLEDVFGQDAELIRLRIDGFTQNQIAEILEISQAEVSRRLQRVGDIVGG